jgi:UDP-glucuronate decarboxylase
MNSPNKIILQDLAYIRSRLNSPEKLKDKTVLVTGFAGFLGFYFTQFFVDALTNGLGLRSLILIDNFIVRTPAWVEELRARNVNIQIRSFDIAKDRLEALQLQAEPHYIIHLASIASPTFYRKYPIETLDANVWGLRSLLDYSRQIDLEGLLFFSSSEIYGDPVSHEIPTTEEYRGNVSCIGPRACYDEAKRFGETMCYLFANTYRLPISIVRPFNNFGPGMNRHDRRVPADFAQAVLGSNDLVIHSDGRPTRTFCYVADGLVGYLNALTYEPFEYFNIGADQPEISVKELAGIYQKLGKELLGYRGRIHFNESTDKNYLIDNPSRRCPDISKARRLLGFDPQIPLEEGIRRYLTFLSEEKEH